MKKSIMFSVVLAIFFSCFFSASSFAEETETQKIEEGWLYFYDEGKFPTLCVLEENLSKNFSVTQKGMEKIRKWNGFNVQIQNKEGSFRDSIHSNEREGSFIFIDLSALSKEKYQKAFEMVMDSINFLFKESFMPEKTIYSHVENQKGKIIIPHFDRYDILKIKGYLLEPMNIQIE